MDYGKNALNANYIGSTRISDAPLAPPVNSAIRDGISNAEQALSNIHEAIARLENRLETALRPLPPSTAPAGNVGVPVSHGSHITGRLNILNEGLINAAQRLADLESRIEV